MNISGSAIFCDDIRQELGGKYSLMGCYTGSIVFSDALPTVCPKFCIQAELSIPLNYDFRTVNFFLEVEMEDGESHKIFETGAIEPERPRNLTEEQAAKDDAVLQINIPVTFTPFEVPTLGVLKMRAYVDDRLIKLGSLIIETATKP